MSYPMSREHLEADLDRLERDLDVKRAEAIYFLKGLGYGLAIGLGTAVAFGWTPWR